MDQDAFELVRTEIPDATVDSGASFPSGNALPYAGFDVGGGKV